MANFFLAHPVYRMHFDTSIVHQQLLWRKKHYRRYCLYNKRSPALFRVSILQQYGSTLYERKKWDRGLNIFRCTHFIYTGIWGCHARRYIRPCSLCSSPFSLLGFFISCLSCNAPTDESDTSIASDCLKILSKWKKSEEFSG